MEDKSNRTIVIGDIHGCAGELSVLLHKLAVQPSDRVIVVGDVVDKGPDSPAVVSILRTLGAELVLGNHEEKLIRFLAHEKRIADFEKANPKQTAKPNPMDRSKIGDYLDKLSQADLDYLSTAKVFVEVPEHGITVLHGGVAPDVKALPGPDAISLSGKGKKVTGKVIRTRNVGKDSGKMLPLGSEGPDDPFWAKVYDGRFGHIVFGHDPSEGAVRCFNKATGIDTGCVFGGALTAAVYTEGREHPDFVQMPAFEKYADRADFAE